MAFSRSAASAILLCGSACLSGATAEPLRGLDPPAAPQASGAGFTILSAPPASGSFALPADRAAEPAPAAPKPKRQARDPAPPIPPAPVPTAAAPAVSEPANSVAPAVQPTAPAAVSAAAPAAASVPAPIAKKPAPIRFAAVSNDPRPALGPETFVATMRAAERYHEIAENGGWGTLPKAAALKLGDKNQLVVRLKERLAASDDLASEAKAGETFDAVTLAAVKRFQGRHGLPETGLVGAKTVEALNVPADARARQLSASAQRLAGTRFPFGERYVVVNIPSATVEAVDKGEVKRRYVAVVGKKDRASPSVMARIATINFNPTWTVPVSLIKKDIIPHMRKDAGYLAKMKIRILDGQGQEVDPRKIDWSTEKAANYILRQDPGATNSLGQIRIDMPNKHAVYMHDTPTKKLFAQSERFHSSGCVRVGDVKDLVAWLLEGTPVAVPPQAAAPASAPPASGAAVPWTHAAIEAATVGGKRQDVALKKPVPVAWVYLTGFATPDGAVHFRDDVYGLDTEPAPAQPLTLEELITSSIMRKPL
jgi:peptidoglycan hydrolase-like protein with peptidoglycan-binding domain